MTQEQWIRFTIYLCMFCVLASFAMGYWMGKGAT
jgi:hypothetical protein